MFNNMDENNNVKNYRVLIREHKYKIKISVISYYYTTTIERTDDKNTKPATFHGNKK